MTGRKRMKRNQPALAHPLWSLRVKLSKSAQTIAAIARKNNEKRTRVQNTPSRG
jgi:hypothetical protein